MGGEGPLVLWNHRWEFDKAPETFARVIRALAGRGLPFRLAIAGEPGDNPSPALPGLRDDLGDRVTHFGRLPREDYVRLLWESDIVVSTSRHDFFGVATVEALYCECFPVVPANYNYPALVPPELHARCLWESEAACVDLLERAITTPATADERALLHSSASRLAWENVAPQWDEALTRLSELGPGAGPIGSRTKRNGR